MGLGIVKKFLGSGASVVVLDFDANLMENLKKEYPSIETHQVNLTDWEGTVKVLENVGTVHHVVNNAGIGRPPETFLEIKPESVDQYFLYILILAILSLETLISLNNGCFSWTVTMQNF